MPKTSRTKLFDNDEVYRKTEWKEENERKEDSSKEKYRAAFYGIFINYWNEMQWNTKTTSELIDFECPYKVVALCNEGTQP